MGYKTDLHVQILAHFLVITLCIQEPEISISNGVNSSSNLSLNSLPAEETRVDDKEVSASHFVASFGPPVPPPDHFHFNSFEHHFTPSPVPSYQYMVNHGYPYAGTYSYKNYATPFIPSPPDHFLNSIHHQPTSEQHYASKYLQYERDILPQSRKIPSKPHVFHNVVNYGSISIHHGDHHEQHNNEKSSPLHLPQNLHHYPNNLRFPHGQHLPFHYHYSTYALPTYPGLPVEQVQVHDGTSSKEEQEKEKNNSENVQKRNSSGS